MSKTQYCKIVHDYDVKQEARRYWVAVLLTADGEEDYEWVEYWDKAYRSDFLSGCLFWINPFAWIKGLLSIGWDKEHRRSDELRNDNRSKLIGKLLEEGWEPYSVSDGNVTMMRREVQ